VLTPVDYRQRVRIPKIANTERGNPFTMRKIVGLALAAAAALAAIAPALADPQLSAECPEMDRLRTTANTLHALADSFEARARDETLVTEENYFARFDAENSSAEQPISFSAPRANLVS
jgi:hypothetical protein